MTRDYCEFTTARGGQQGSAAVPEAMDLFEHNFESCASSHTLNGVGTEWPDQVTAIFIGGPLDALVLDVPARRDMTPLAVRLVPDSDPPLVFSSTEQTTGARYLNLSKMRARDPNRYESWPD